MRIAIILGAVLRILFLGGHDFWFDEKASIFVSNQSLLNLLTATARDTHTPLYFLLLKTWSLASTDLLFLRLLSVIFGIFSIAIAYKVFLKLTNEKVAKLASLLFALSPLHIYYSTEIRMYSLLVLTILLVAWFTLKYIEKKKKRFLFYIFLASSVALYTHYYALLAIIGVNIAYFSLIRLRHKPRAWLTTQGVIALSFLPWLGLSSLYLKPGCWCFSPIIGIPASFASFTVGGVGIVTIRDYVFSAPTATLWLFVVSSIYMTLLFLIGSWKALVNKKFFMLSLFFIPLILSALIGLVLPFFSPRALIIISPYFYLLISVGIHSFKAKSTSSFLKLVAVLTLALILLIQFTNPFFRKLPDYKQYLKGTGSPVINNQ